MNGGESACEKIVTCDVKKWRKKRFFGVKIITLQSNREIADILLVKVFR